MTKKERNYFFNKLAEHVGHSIDIVGYQLGELTRQPTFNPKDYANISIECIDCNEVLIDFEN